MEQTKVSILPDGRMTRRSAALYLGVATKTLATWSMNGTGPNWVKPGGRVFYFKKDLDDFVEAGRQPQQTIH